MSGRWFLSANGTYMFAVNERYRGNVMELPTNDGYIGKVFYAGEQVAWMPFAVREEAMEWVEEEVVLVQVERALELS